MNFLPELKDTYKGGGVILPDLRRHVLREAAEDDGRDNTVLHPSEMAKYEWCPRKDYYRITGAPAGSGAGQKTSFRQQNIFAEGHSIHDKYQRWLGDMGVLVGDWQCRECGGLHRNTVRPDHLPNRYGWPNEVGICGAPKDYGSPDAICTSTRFRYREVPLRDPALLLGGHADGVLFTDAHRLLEVKTIGLGTIRILAPRLYERYLAENWTLDELWMNVNRPLAPHVRQASLYTHMARRDYTIDEIVFLYEFKANQDVKEFVVKYDPPVELLALAKSVADAVQQGGPPPARLPRFEEQGQTGKDCSACPYQSICWGSLSASPVPSPKPKLIRTTSTKRKKALSRV